MTMSQPEQPMKSSAMVTGTIMVAAVIAIFMAFLFALFLYLHAKRYWGANPTLGRGRGRSRARLAIADEDAVLRRGLDPAAIKVLPSMVFRLEEFKEGLECAVCLSELLEGEEARLLPGCRHGFHLECIDIWLNFHSTCPLCRSPLSSENADSGVQLAEASQVEAVLAAGRQPESPIFPTNVLFWGSQDWVRTGGLAAAAAAAAGSCEGSSSSVGSSSRRPEGKLVIDVPRRAMEGCQSPVLPMPLSRLPVDEVKSPTSARLRLLRRLLSQGNRGIGSSCSLRGGDIEQGAAGVGVTADGVLQMPKTSTSS